MKKLALSTAAFFCLLLFSITAGAKEKNREYYQITVYHFTDSEQEQAIDAYLKGTYVPALHRMGNTTIGVFKPIANDTTTDKLLFIVTPFSKADLLLSLPIRLQKDLSSTLGS